MPDYRQHFGGFLKAADIGEKRIKVTVEHVSLERLKRPNGDEEEKLVATFKGAEKRLVLNKTNCEALAAASGSHDYDDWPGVTVGLYVDPTVMMGGQRVGGLRIAVLTQPAVEPEPEPQPQDSSGGEGGAWEADDPGVTDDDLPF